MRPRSFLSRASAPCASSASAQRRVDHHRHEHPRGQRHLERLDDPAAGAGGSDLAQVRRHDDGGAADAEPDDEPPDDERPEAVSQGHDQRAHNKGGRDPPEGRDAAVGLHARPSGRGTSAGAGLCCADGGPDGRVREGEVPREGQGGAADESFGVAVLVELPFGLRV